MKHRRSRHDFMKSMLAVPIAAYLPMATDAMARMISGPGSTSEKFGHKLKISLNVYSFNILLREGR